MFTVHLDDLFRCPPPEAWLSVSLQACVAPGFIQPQAHTFPTAVTSLLGA